MCSLPLTLEPGYATDLNATGNDVVEKSQNNNQIGNGSNIHVVLFILDNNTLTSSTFVCLK